VLPAELDGGRRGDYRLMEYVTLMGAEDVSRAGRNIANASEEMLRAANLISESLGQHRNWMDDWLARFQQALEDDRDARRNVG